MNALPNRVPARAVLHVRVGDDVRANLARARETMTALQQGKRPKPHFAVGFAQVGQMLAVPRPLTLAWLFRAACRLDSCEPSSTFSSNMCSARMPIPVTLRSQTSSGRAPPPKWPWASARP